MFDRSFDGLLFDAHEGQVRCYSTMPLHLHTICLFHTASSFPPLVSCAATLTVFARCGTSRQYRTGPSWSSNDDPLKDLSNTRALKHLAPLATDYWAASIVSSNLD